ncbi:MAG: DUF1573 domain-containing protein [Dysgonamonadaceae bacterium]|nr:DUF1573 domain-containing protein [Dysgonamonadaceae bacterium]
MKHLFLFMVLLCVPACKKEAKTADIESIVKKWQGKEIRFPENAVCFSMGKEIICPVINKPYKILMYLDSASCMSCNLKLYDWKQLIQEADSLFLGKLDFLLYLQVNDDKILTNLLKKEHFEYPVYIDRNNQMDKLNRFPNQPEFRCFLLDSDNKVLLIGNPTIHPKIWELYKTQITGKEQTEIPLTTIQPDKISHNYGTIKKGSKNKMTFFIENTGEQSLVISRVSVSCGCTDVIWDKYPIEKGHSAKIIAEITPDEDGYFSKTIEVFGNMESSPVKLTINGWAIE